MTVVPAISADVSVLLKNVSWATYDGLTRETGESTSQRFAYDQGTLEILMPAAAHEETNRTIAALVEFVAVEWDIETRNLGSATFKHEELARGFEPDTCFYIQNVEAVAGRGEIDLTEDPAPDLVIEIDITHPSLEKLPLYARLGVAEVWRYQREQVMVYVLEGGEYQEREASHVLPLLTRQALNDLLAQNHVLPRTRWVRAVQAWARGAAEGQTPAIE